MINSIKDELELYESSNDEKHLYAIEKLVQLLKGENNSTTNETSKRKKKHVHLKNVLSTIHISQRVIIQARLFLIFKGVL